MIQNKVKNKEISEQEAINMMGVKLWRTPASSEPGISAERLKPIDGGKLGGMNRHFDKETGRMAQIGLTQQVQLRQNWPTPRNTEIGRSKTAKGTHGFNIIAPDGREWGANLATVVNMWPTPTKQDGENNGGFSQYKRNTIPLNALVKKFPTPQASMMTEADMEQANFAGNSPNRPKYCDAGKGSLNPDWTEWLLGWPMFWTSLEPITELIWLDWSIDPADTGNIPRVATKIKDRVNRLKAIGNGQVPQCFATAWRILINHV